MMRIAIVVAIVSACSSREPAPTSIVFVCEHGSAKSVVAAALFNDLAAKRGLPWRAVARGLEPDPALAPAVVRGLAEDGLTSPVAAPVALSADDRRAPRVILLGDEQRDVGPHGQTWTAIPPVSQDYARSRDAIRVRVAQLIEQLRTPPKHE